MTTTRIVWSRRDRVYGSNVAGTRRVPATIATDGVKRVRRGIMLARPHTIRKRVVYGTIRQRSVCHAMDRCPVDGGKCCPVLSVRPAASNRAVPGVNGKTSCGQASPWAMDGSPCCSPPGYTLVPGCCECSRHCCDNAWGRLHREHRARLTPFGPAWACPSRIAG